MACWASTNSSALRSLSLTASADLSCADLPCWSWGVGVAALGQRAAGADQESQGDGQNGWGKLTQDETLKLKYPATHTFPDWLNSLRQNRALGLDAVQIGPQCGGDGSGFP